ncbi:hypothetical protein LguiB_005753 [Lonicera macranthoides]
MAREMDYGAFMEKFTLQPLPSTTENLALNNLTFTVKDILMYITFFDTLLPFVLGIITARFSRDPEFEERSYMRRVEVHSSKLVELPGFACTQAGIGPGRLWACRSKSLAPLGVGGLWQAASHMVPRGWHPHVGMGLLLYYDCNILGHCYGTQRFDVDGYVTGFGNPDWARTHSAATSTAPSVLALLAEGATCVGKTVMDEMAYSINGENVHYGTPTNPRAPDRVPGGSSSGSAVSVGATLVDFSLGTDTGGSVRVPASYCGILGFRPSHGLVPTTGVIPMAQSFDTVGWFARDPLILNRIGQVLLQLPHVDPVTPTNIIIAEDCFKLLSIPSDRVTKVLIKSIDKIFGGARSSSLRETLLGPLGGVSRSSNQGHIVNYASIGDYVESKVPSLKRFMVKGVESQEYSIESLTALSSAMRSLQRCGSTSTRLSWDFYVYTFSDLHDNCDIGQSFIMYKSAYFFLLLFMLWSLITYLLKHRYEFKNNHGEWVSTVKPDLGPGISERIWEALQSTDENIDACHPVKNELRSALTALLGDYGILVIPSVPGPPPKLKTEPSTLETFRARAFSLLSIAGVSGFCQVSIPLGMYDNLPVSVSLLAKHGSDGFLLNVVETIYGTLKEHVEIAENLSY